MIDWQAVGTAIGGLLIGAGGVGLWWRRQVVESVRQGAEVDVITLMRDEIARLGARVGSLEAREGRMIRHIYRLEGLMRAKDIEPPPFDIDSDSIKVGGTE